MWFLQPGITFNDVLMRIIAILVIVFLILPFHEFAHAFVAYKLGDNTAKYMGRMTINPLSHFDPMGAVCMMLFDFGWAKPVPVNDSNFKNPRRDMALVSAAGPCANLFAALIGGFLMNLILALGIYNKGIYSFFINYITINIGLALFNLLPLMSFDGYRIMEALIPRRFLEGYYKYKHIISLILFGLVFLGFFSGPIVVLKQYILNFILKITSFRIIHA